jgi:hypothetical protein
MFCRAFIFVMATFFLPTEGLMAIPAEPSYGGRTFSQWMSEIDPHSMFTGEEAAVVAIRAIGTNAIPILLEWVAEQELKGASCLTPSHAQRAVVAFLLLDDIARPAIPKLRDLALSMKTYDSADRCVRSLAYIGPRAVPSFVEILKRGGYNQRFAALSSLAVFHKDAAPAVPAAVQCLVGKNKSIAGKAADELSRLEVPATVLELALSEAFPAASPDGKIRILQCIGWTDAPKRHRLAKLLKQASEDQNPKVRAKAKQILQRNHPATDARG